jgi:hypothetical protein
VSRSTVPLTALEARKQLLTLEAELQREQLAAELETFKEDLSNAGRRARSFGAVAASAAAVATAVMAFRRRKTDGAPKRSLVSRLWSGVRLASGVWRAVGTLTARNGDLSRNGGR